MKIAAPPRLRMSAQLYLLVTLMLVLFAGQAIYMMRHVGETEKTLKFTIDNRLKTAEFLQDISDALQGSLEHAHRVARKAMTPDEALATLRPELDQARANWDNYYLASKIPEEEKLAEETTEVLDHGFNESERLLTKLKAGDAGLDAWTLSTLLPAVTAAESNVKRLIDLQADAAALDERNTKAATTRTLWTAGLMTSAATLLSIALGFLIIRNAQRRLGTDPAEAAEIANRIARGDYDFDLPDDAPPDSLLAALRHMKDSLLHSKLDYEGQLTAISRSQAVIEFTPEGLVLDANDNFLKLMGYSLDEIKGKHHSMFLQPHERELSSYKQFWARMKRGQFWSGSFGRLTKVGDEIWLQATYNPIIDASGKVFKVVKYAHDVTDQRNAAQLNAAFKGALEKLGVNVVVADNDYNVIYVNEPGRAMFVAIQGELRKEFPNFDARNVVGQSLDAFSLNPVAQRRLLDELVSTHVAEVRIGGRTMRQIFTPMRDESGKRLGTVIEWLDRTQELATELELQEVVGAVTSGDLARRIQLAGKTGFFESLSRGINDLVDNVGMVVDEVQALVESANAGDLTRRVKVEGRAGLLLKIGGGINQLTDNMANVVAQVKLAAGEVSRGADEISQGNTNLSQRTEEQASSLEETASSMEEMTSTVKQNADNAGQANQLAVAARDQAEKGGAVVARAVAAMSGINDASKRIADIIGVIDEIAFQTNLLALNAAVEAARAGEQGRGFAVVASEVRNLAGRSATAAKEIKALIHDSVRRVDEGSALVTQSGLTLDQIVAAVKKVTDIVAEIAAASHEQSAGIDQVNKAIMQLDELTQQNAALVEQASAASQAMAEQARGLNANMSRYTVLATVTEAIASKANATAIFRPERRKTSRPWSQGGGSRASDPAPSREPMRDNRASGRGEATATDDSVWKEF
ncbi:MAG: methyl-accepting chemotaxis protein [Steroidobacteraceae bacterium]